MTGDFTTWLYFKNTELPRFSRFAMLKALYASSGAGAELHSPITMRWYIHTLPAFTRTLTEGSVPYLKQDNVE